MTYLADLTPRLHPRPGPTRPAPAPADRADWLGREFGLSRRESDVMCLIAHAFTNRDIAARLFVSENTIKSNIRSCYQKLAIQTRSEAVVWSIENGFRPDIYIPAQPPSTDTLDAPPRALP